MDMVRSPRRFEVMLVNLDPTVGAEIQKTRPAVIVSPDEMNRHLAKVIIAPLTSTLRGWPTRVPCKLQGRSGEVALDQVRAVDKARLVRKLGRLSSVESERVIAVLLRIFAK